MRTCYTMKTLHIIYMYSYFKYSILDAFRFKAHLIHDQEVEVSLMCLGTENSSSE